MTSTEKTLLYAGGAFLLYKLFIAPKTTTIPTQANPVYTSGLTTSQPVTSSAGSIMALGAGLVSTIAKALSNDNSGSAPAAAAQPVSVTQQAANNNVASSVDNIFSSVPSLSSTNNSAANNFGLPTTISLTDTDEDD